MTHFKQHLITASVFALCLPAWPVLAQTTPVPSNLQPPAGHVLYLKLQAAGTQNYVCLPAADGPGWKFLGPQATLFLNHHWFQGDLRQQIATHFLSTNPDEEDVARPTWQSSFDTSTVWGKAIADSKDPNFVAPDSIPWLLLEIVGRRRGPAGGAILHPATFIQRVNTLGGIAPATGCTESTYGKLALVPYTTDYLFYQPERRR